MIIAYIVNIINAVLGFVLIFGVDLSFVSIPGYGIEGAAWAVSISRGVGGLLSIGALYLPKSKIKVNIFTSLKLNSEILVRMLKVGVPAALEQIIMQGGILVMQIVISGMGTAAIAVYQIGMSINSMSYAPIWGFGIAATTLVGQSLGEKNPRLAEKSTWSTMKISVIISMFLTIGIFIFAGKLAGLYTKDTMLIDLGTTAIRIFSISLSVT